MKIAGLFLLGLLMLYTQFIFAPHIAIAGIIPNLLIAYVIFISTRLSQTAATVLTFFIIIAFDVQMPCTFGLHTTVLLSVAWFISRYHAAINKEKLISVSLSILLVVFSYISLTTLFSLISTQIVGANPYLFVLNVFYNTGITIVLVYFFNLLSYLRITLNVR
ncbi:MAG: rod shape-determining protein MreD [Candidatus Cloacimonetes bacterium]|nr:rod shape-determining protein MreD [Candidatus Cloacimonadota bacterium]